MTVPIPVLAECRGAVVCLLHAEKGAEMGRVASCLRRHQEPSLEGSAPHVCLAAERNVHIEYLFAFNILESKRAQYRAATRCLDID